MNNLPENYDINKYDRPSVAVDTVVFTIRKTPCESYRHLSGMSLSVLMVKRKELPYKDYISLPGGFAERNETVEDTAKRKLYEKTGIKNLPVSLLYNFSAPNRDPRGWIISCGYWTLVESSHAEISDNAEWYSIDYNDNSLTLVSDNGEEYKTVFEIQSSAELYNEAPKIKIISSQGIAFDHSEIIIRAIMQLRDSLEYPYAAFRLLPEYFTLTELQQVYETILGKSLLMANFRRKISAYVEESGKSETGAGHRPSKLFKAVKK
ncbi:MAG: NUDIX hydrolase [Oscillospiraceae bacterium]